VFRGYEIISDIYGLINDNLADSQTDIVNIIKNHSDSIVLNINEQQKTLKQFILDAAKLGWSEQDCLNIF